MVYNFLSSSSFIVSKEHRILNNVKESRGQNCGTIFGFACRNWITFIRILVSRPNFLPHASLTGKRSGRMVM